MDNQFQNKISSHLIQYENVINSVWRQISDYVKENKGKEFKTIVFIQMEIKDLIKSNWEYVRTGSLNELEKHIFLMNPEDIHKQHEKLLKKNNGGLAHHIRNALKIDPNQYLIIISNFSNSGKENFNLDLSKLHTFKLDDPFDETKLTQVMIGFDKKLLELGEKERSIWVENVKERIRKIVTKPFEFPPDVKEQFDLFIKNGDHKEKVIIIERYGFHLFKNSDTVSEEKK